MSASVCLSWGDTKCAVRFADLATVASSLSLLRIALAAVLPLLPQPWWLPVYLLAVATDVVDGMVARRTGTVSAAGATLDAWADKILHVNVAWTLVNAGVIPGWWMSAWFAREILQVPMVFALVHRWRTGVGTPRTRLSGRLTTILLSVLTVLALVGWPSLLLTVAVLVLGLMAGIDYARLHFAHLCSAEAP